MKVMYGGKEYEETNREYLMGLSDESKEKWLMELLSSPKKIYSGLMTTPIVHIPNNEVRKEWLSERDAELILRGVQKQVGEDISCEPHNGIPLDFIAMQYAIFKATEQGIPINEHYDAMLLILKYYDNEGALFAISDKLINSPEFIAKVLSRGHTDSYGDSALELIGVEDSTWSQVAKIIDNDNIKSRLIKMRLESKCFRYDLVHYYEKYAEKYYLDEILNYQGYLELEDIPMPDCNDKKLLMHLLTLEDEYGNPVFEFGELPNYFGSKVKKDSEFQLKALIKALTIRNEKLGIVEAEEKAISDIEAKISKFIEGQNIGE